MLIGTSARTGAFTEAIVRDMAANAGRPVILPMSNPTALAEAVPADLIRWTDGRALVAAGSPFGAVDHDGIRYEIGQANNALVFPGLGLGVIAARARRVTDGMLLAAARAVADMVDISAPGAPLLPRVADLRETSVAVAVAVASAAARRGRGVRHAGRRPHRPGEGADVGAALPPGQASLRATVLVNSCARMTRSGNTRNQLTVFRATHIIRQAATTRIIPTELSIAVFTVAPPR